MSSDRKHPSISGRALRAIPARPKPVRWIGSAAMPRRYFGTDGVRGGVGEDLTRELVEKLGRPSALWSKGRRVFVGRDTRGSGPELEEAFARGVSSAGGDAVLAGGLAAPRLPA